MSLLLALTGGGGPVTIDFSSATTNGADVLAAAVSPIIGVSSSNTDGADVLASSVAPIIGVTSATTDGADIASSAIGVLVDLSSAISNGADLLNSQIDVISDSPIKDGGDDVPRKIKTEKYKPRLKKDDFGNEIQPVIVKQVVKKQYTIQDTKLLLDKLELQAEQDDEEAILMLL